MTGMVGIGRKPEGTRVDVRIPADVLRKIDALAKAEGVKRAAIIRDLLKAATK